MRPLRPWISSLLLVLLLERGAIADTAAPPVFRSNSGQFTLLEPARPAPDVSIRALDGGNISINQFRGTVVIVNFWATWCGPCVYEMPSLDRLAARNDDRLRILAVSIDREGGAAVARFVAEHDLTHLTVYLDPDQRLGSLAPQHAPGTLPLWGLPITYVIDGEGRVTGFITGAADWDSTEARRFLDYFISAVAP